jgi:hypothetical protein
MADTPELGRALAEFAAACSVMAEPSVATAPTQHPSEDPVPAFLGRSSAAAEAARAQPPGARPPQPAPAARPLAPASASTNSDAPPAEPRQPAPLSRRPEETLAAVERRLGLREPEG